MNWKRAFFAKCLKTQHFRGWMGPELQIVVLDMSLEEQMDRMRKRHLGNEAAVEFAKVNCDLLE